MHAWGAFEGEKGRLQLDDPTITTTDLLLEKMQIAEINLKDIKDTLVLLLDHPIGDPPAGKESIDADVIGGRRFEREEFPVSEPSSRLGLKWVYRAGVKRSAIQGPRDPLSSI